MDCAKSIDELYNEVKDQDLVVTNDAALATALNGRVDKPIIGPFAVTPKMIAGMVGPEVVNKPVHRDLRVITDVSKNTGRSFRYVHGEIENIKEIRKYTKSVKDHLHTNGAKDVYNYFIEEPTQTLVMDRFSIEDHHFFDSYEKIAVIGLDLFNDLDKHFVPYAFKDVQLFKSGSYDIDVIHEIGNDRQIAENAVDLIDPEKAQDYAIVLNSNSPITDAVRAALYRKGISFVNSLNVKDLTQIRDYLQFLTLAMSYRTLRVKHVRELFQSYNAKLDADKDEFLLSKQLEGYMKPNARKLTELMANIGSMTFGKVIEELKHAGVPQVHMLLKDMDMEDKPVTEERVSQLVYAVNNVSDLHHNEEIPENERTGVLITDCKNSVYIDRPVVLYLGMEQDWNISVVGRKYIDSEAEAEKNKIRMEILLQQGSKRIYMVNTTKNGHAARPSMIFDQIIDKPATDFTAICGELRSGRWTKSASEIERSRGSEPLDGVVEFNAPFSKSSFNDYITCPRKFMYSSLIGSPDQQYTEFGNLIHAFAELYVCYPETVKHNGVDRYVEMITDQYAGLSSPLMKELDSGRIRVALVNVMRFVDRYNLNGVPLDTSLTLKKHPNKFMELSGLDMTSSACETDENPRGIPVHGHFDVYWNGTVVDYKTGKAHNGSEIVKSMNLAGKPKYVEFQPLLYLAMASKRAGSKGEFDLFFAMDKDVESLEENFDISRNVRRVFIREGSLADVVAGSTYVRELMAVKFRKEIRDSSETFIDLFGQMAQGPPEDWPSDTGMINSIIAALGQKNNKTWNTVVNSGLKKLRDTVYAGMVFTDTTVEIPRETLDRFMDNVNKLHQTAVVQASTELPADPLKNCDTCEYYYACTKDIITIEEEAEE